MVPGGCQNADGKEATRAMDQSQRIFTVDFATDMPALIQPDDCSVTHADIAVLLLDSHPVLGSRSYLIPSVI